MQDHIKNTHHCTFGRGGALSVYPAREVPSPIGRFRREFSRHGRLDPAMPRPDEKEVLGSSARMTSASRSRRRRSARRRHQDATRLALDVVLPVEAGVIAPVRAHLHLSAREDLARGCHEESAVVALDDLARLGHAAIAGMAAFPEIAAAISCARETPAEQTTAKAKSQTPEPRLTLAPPRYGRSWEQAVRLSTSTAQLGRRGERAGGAPRRPSTTLRRDRGDRRLRKSSTGSWSSSRRFRPRPSSCGRRPAPPRAANTR